MFIQTETTPNPATIKFIPGCEILPVQDNSDDKTGGSGNISTLDFASAEDAGISPLALRLFAITGVERVFLSRDYISVSKADDTDWSILKPMVLAAIMEHLSTAQPVVNMDINSGAACGNKKADEPEGEIAKQIRELIETRVRPMVAMDGGDIVFESFDDGIVSLKMRGACSGCPSSTATLKHGIENMLKHFIPEVTEVRAIGE